MAFDGDQLLDAEVTSGDLSAKQWLAVTLGSSGLAVAGANATRIYGILTDTPPSGKPGSVARYGSISKAVAGAAVTKGALLTTDSSGRLVTATSGQHVHARAKTAASGAASIFTVELGFLGDAP